MDARRSNSALSFRHFAQFDFGDKDVDWCLRLSPHYYSTEREVDQVVAAVADLGAAPPGGGRDDRRTRARLELALELAGVGPADADVHTGPVTAGSRRRVTASGFSEADIEVGSSPKGAVHPPESIDAAWQAIDRSPAARRTVEIRRPTHVRHKRKYVLR